MARRDFARTLAALRLLTLALLALTAALAVRAATYVVVPVASGPPVVWWDTRFATTAAILAALLVYPLASLVLVRRPERREVRR